MRPRGVVLGPDQATIEIDTIYGVQVGTIRPPARTVDGAPAPDEARGLVVADCRDTTARGGWWFSVTHTAARPSFTLGVFATLRAAQSFARHPLVTAVDWNVATGNLHERIVEQRPEGITEDQRLSILQLRQDLGGRPGLKRFRLAEVGDRGDRE